MAYNSDGYIMLDFTEVDFRRTNQTIDGLFKRCVDVIGTNKFILVINANGRTPLPATCSFTNNQYVIDTVIYMFAVSSNDNLFIRRNDVPASDIIDDSSISVDKTWSSNKIDSELDTKADASSLADYQPLLTAGEDINIDENNVISALTVKHFTYIGINSLINRRIVIPEGCKCILSIEGDFTDAGIGGNYNFGKMITPISFVDGELITKLTEVSLMGNNFSGISTVPIKCSIYGENILQMESFSNPTYALNLNNITYHVFYI